MDIPGELQTLVFVLFFIAFAVKAPLPPFHTWLPAVAMGGPAGIAIFLVGLKLGTYGMIKILLPLVPDAVVAWQPFLIWYGILAMLYGGFVALAQNNLRRMLAYASVSHVGMVVAGIFALNAMTGAWRATPPRPFRSVVPRRRNIVPASNIITVEAIVMLTIAMTLP